MHILTSDKLTKSQLSLLLRDLGHAPRFHSELSELFKVLEVSQPRASVLIDLQFELNDAGLELMQSKNQAHQLIGFERHDADSPTPIRIPANSFSTSIIIPTHSERAKLRLKNALRAGNTLKRPAKPLGSTRPPFSFSKADKKPNLLSNSKTTRSKNLDTTRARYLIADSPSSIKLFETLKRFSQKKGLLILEANEEAEFEIIARELNFLSNSDTSTLYIIDNNNLRIDYLQKLERKANKSKVVMHCYVGRTDELDEVAASELRLFGEYLCNLRNPHMRLIVGHEKKTEEFYRNGVAEHLNSFVKKAERIKIPSLGKRAEDIPAICQLTLSFLRTVHPFLIVQRISKEAELYLCEQRHQYSYTKLVRILRNAIALSQRDYLSVEDIKNYGESSMTTQHLLETMADENYFPQSANF